MIYNRKTIMNTELFELEIEPFSTCVTQQMNCVIYMYQITLNGHSTQSKLLFRSI